MVVSTAAADDDNDNKQESADEDAIHPPKILQYENQRELQNRRYDK